jgi:hypothetical protein
MKTKRIPVATALACALVLETLHNAPKATATDTLM